MSAGRTAPALTIYTDASYLDGNGGWAAVMVRSPEDFRIISGRLKQGCPSSTHAEFYAICNALHMVTRHTRKPSSITIYTDCRILVSLCRDRAPGRKSKGKWNEGLEKLETILAALAGVPLEYRWIKGHQPKTGECDHGYFNRLADRAAGKENGYFERKRASRAKWRANRRERKKIERLAHAREEQPHGA